MKRLIALSVVLVSSFFLLYGCSGDDGAPGVQGPAGAPGVPQPVKILYLGAVSVSSIDSMIVYSNKKGYFPAGTELYSYSFNSETPAVSFLREFDVILVFTDGFPDDSESTGDNLASYVDAGGTLVITSYCYSTAGYGMRGRIMEEGYSPFQVTAAAGVGGYRAIDFTSLSFPLHPIFNGVDMENCPYWSNGNISNPTMDPTATLLATDDQGANAIAINADGNIIALNLYARYNMTNSYPQFQNAGRLIANALLYIAGSF